LTGGPAIRATFGLLHAPRQFFIAARTKPDPGMKKAAAGSRDGFGFHCKACALRIHSS